MNAWIPTFAFLAAVMNDLVESDVSAPFKGVLEAVYLGLFIAPTPVPSPSLTLAGITEADYDGYARQPIVWWPTFVDQAGPQDLAAQNLHFAPTDATVQNTITGAFIVSALTGGTLWLACIFATPVLLAGPTYAMDAAPVFQLAFTSNYGKCLVFA